MTALIGGPWKGASVHDLAIEHLVCPKCGAEPRVNCLTPSGKAATYPHRARTDAAQAVYAAGREAGLRVPEGPPGTCSIPGCANRYKTDRWGRMDDVDAGWFIKRNGEAWCPEHVPEWVGPWRKRQAEQKRKKQAAARGPAPCDICEGTGLILVPGGEVVDCVTCHGTGHHAELD